MKSLSFLIVSPCLCGELPRATLVSAITDGSSTARVRCAACGLAGPIVPIQIDIDGDEVDYCAAWEAWNAFLQEARAASPKSLVIPGSDSDYWERERRRIHRNAGLIMASIRVRRRAWKMGIPEDQVERLGEEILALVEEGNDVD